MDSYISSQVSTCWEGTLSEIRRKGKHTAPTTAASLLCKHSRSRERWRAIHIQIRTPGLQLFLLSCFSSSTDNPQPTHAHGGDSWPFEWWSCTSFKYSKRYLHHHQVQSKHFDHFTKTFQTLFLMDFLEEWRNARQKCRFSLTQASIFYVLHENAV